MKTLLEELDAKKAELAALQPMKPEDAERLWKKFRLEWNYNSNHIEGNTLTYQETELVLIFDQAPSGNHTVREIEEMKAHDVAIALVREWATDESRELLESDIRSLNKTLLVRPFWNEAMTPDGQPTRRLISIGEYKKHPNSVRLSNGEMFHYSSPEETPLKMDDLMTWYRQAAQEHHPAIVAAKLHYDFVRIHPFDDGNGRVSRLLMNYHLLRHDFPPVIIKSNDKKNYLAALNRADVGDFEAFARYIAEQMLWSLELNIQAAKGESIEEEGDWGKQVELLRREAEAMNKNIAGLKLDQKESLERWLDINIPILEQEMKARFEPFKGFFESVEFKVSSPENSSSTASKDWRKISELVDKGHRHTIVIAFFGNGFQFEKLFYHANKVRKVLPSTYIDIQLYSNTIQLFPSWNERSKFVPISHNLTKSDLQPIHDLAKMFYDQIQTAIAQS